LQADEAPIIIAFAFHSARPVSSPSSLRCHPTRVVCGRPEGPLFVFAFGRSYLLLSSRARPFSGRRGTCCSLGSVLFLFSSSLRCHPERGRFLADEGPAVRGFCSFYDVGRKREACPANSSHVGFVRSISAIFLARRQPLISFSRRIAALMSLKTS
jgi:hypothetical protein